MDTCLSKLELHEFLGRVVAGLADDSDEVTSEYSRDTMEVEFERQNGPLAVGLRGSRSAEEILLKECVCACSRSRSSV